MKGSQGDKRRTIARGVQGASGKWSWLAVSVLVTRCGVAGKRYSYNLPETGACRWGVKGRLERYRLGFWAGTFYCSIAFERTVPYGGVRAATSWVARKEFRRW